ncbi:MAG: ABC transporter ATP-binding protein [Candidatus Eremiobacteraeota bacterium]|nr:ABC transporter ATP-binding protein [Candidatus Eremiobacteraeota bacterium]MBV8434564.1 ABC transporter ATP-binding protein [Candidatus Eremiobacteraeota bacterium]
MSTIEISHLRKTYGPYAAVDDLSLGVDSGTVFGLLGPNGAGKTTTFKCMLGLARATAGSVTYDGKPLVPQTFERIAYVPERSVLYEWMTVAEHVEMNRRAFTKFDAARAGELLTAFQIDPRKKARALSKGMRTAVMVAVAFARNADLLILDEPTSGLDPVNQRHVLSLMINEAARGCTIIFSSHQIGQVERAAEQIAVIDKGRLVLKGAVDDLKADRKIVEGILPDANAALNGIADDPRILRADRAERIVRLLVNRDADGVATLLGSAGAAGVRVVDLNLEDIFLYAVSPADATADVVAKETAR